jgi:hypothetical protein
MFRRELRYRRPFNKAFSAVILHLRLVSKAFAIATALQSWTPRAANRQPNQNHYLSFTMKVRCHYFGTLFADAPPSLIAKFVLHIQHVVPPSGANPCTSKAHRVYLLQTIVGSWHDQMSLSTIRDLEYFSSM